MSSGTPKKTIEELLEFADITINGPQPWDIQVHDQRLYHRLITKGSLGLGESYVDGWWDVEQLDTLICKILRADLVERISHDWRYLILYLRSTLFNMQTRGRARDAIRTHYDRDLNLYLSFLDPYLQYSCGYFKGTDDLDVAQEKKLDLVCRKLQLEEGHQVLDIGCGWGGFAKYAAVKYGCHVQGITLSESQCAYAREFCKGLPVQIDLSDYRDLNGQYDRIVSIGMFEHVGYKNYRKFMQVVRNCIRPGGIFLLHTIGGNESTHSTDRWLARYIFPNSMLPSVKQVGNATDKLFVMEDWHNFGPYYAKTLRAWMHNFDASWDKLKHHFDERFYRMWKYYLLMCAGTFDARYNQLWQIILTPKGIQGGYPTIR